jgi:ATP-dependent Clp protease ATP-binding subunit ClpA
VRFGRGAKKVLELALREAVREHSREIRSEHIALAVLRTDDDAVRMLLGSLGVDVRTLRADLEGRGRRTA